MRERFIPLDDSAIFIVALRQEEKVIAPPKGTLWSKAKALPPVEPPTALMVGLSSSPAGRLSIVRLSIVRLSIVRLSGPTTAVLHRLKETGTTEPHEIRSMVRKRRPR